MKIIKKKRLMSQKGEGKRDEKRDGKRDLIPRRRCAVSFSLFPVFNPPYALPPETGEGTRTEKRTQKRSRKYTAHRLMLNARFETSII